MGTTLGKPPSSKAIKAFHAMVRKDLREQPQTGWQSDGGTE